MVALDDLRRAPWLRPLLFVVGVNVLVAASWSVLLYPLAGNDEPAHVDVALTVARDLTYPQPPDSFVSEQVRATARVLGNPGDRSRRFTTQGASDPLLDVTFAELGSAAPTGKYNQIAQHPPLYYVATAAGVGLLGGTERLAWPVVLGVMRLVNVLAMGVFAAATFATAARVTGEVRVAVTAGLVSVMVPRMLHTAGTVNNDILLAAAAAIATAAGAWLLTGDRRPRVFVVLGAAVGAALATKLFAAVLPVWVVAVAAMLLWRERDWSIARRVVGAGVVALVCGGWWWVRNLYVFGGLEPPTRTRTRVFAGTEQLGTLDDYLGTFLERFLSSIFWAPRFGRGSAYAGTRSPPWSCSPSSACSSRDRGGSG